LFGAFRFLAALLKDIQEQLQALGKGEADAANLDSDASPGQKPLGSLVALLNQKSFVVLASDPCRCSTSARPRSS